MVFHIVGWYFSQVQIEGEPVDEDPGWRPRGSLLRTEARPGGEDHQKL